MPTPTIPISQLLAKFLREKEEVGKRTRTAKMDTAVALGDKKRSVYRYYDKQDEADAARLDKEIGPFDWGDVGRVMARRQMGIKPRIANRPAPPGTRTIGDNLADAFREAIGRKPKTDKK